MKNHLKAFSTHYSMLFIASVIIWVSANMNWGDERWNRIVNTDGNGYYAYLPALFIYQDLNFSFFDRFNKHVDNNEPKQDFRVKTANGTINKYYVGTAIAQAPFFMLGHLANLLTANPLDGYSVYYMIFLQIGTIFYALLALYLLVLILKHFSVSNTVSGFILLLVVFATNVFHYVVSEPSFSHIPSFAFVNLFILGSLRFFQSKKSIPFIVAMFALGMVVLIRPVNGLVVASLPFLAMNPNDLYVGVKKLFNKPLVLLGGLMLTLVVIGIQLIVYKIQTGSFWVYAYGGEELQLTKPNMLKFMFSYRKGFFLYTPILFLSLFGSYFIYKSSKYRFFCLIAFLAFVVYVLSSWWMWYYGGSFSSRVMIEYYAYFFIPMAILIQNSRLKKSIIVLSLVLLVVCQVQTYQYRYGYIHWYQMNKERYWNNFLRIDKLINKEKDW